MVTLEAIRSTIKDIERNGDSLGDLHDLNMLYELEERMLRRPKTSQSAKGNVEITREDAERWVSEMRNEDPAKPEGGKWSIDQAKPYAQKHGIRTDGPQFFEFYVMMNAMYSDYSEVAKKFNAATPDFFAEMAKAFIMDRDAKPGKVAAYFENLVEK